MMNDRALHTEALREGNASSFMLPSWARVGLVWQVLEVLSTKTAFAKRCYSHLMLAWASQGVTD